MIYTKDKLTEILIDQVRKNTEAFDGVKGALEKINDQNLLHAGADEARDLTITKLVAGNEKFYKVVTYILILCIAALILLAGAEKVLKIIPFMQ